jgi:hypothetical protein
MRAPLFRAPPLFLFFALGVGPAVAQESEDSADEPVRKWEPGERTTSRVAPEVDRQRDSPARDGVHGRFDGDLDFGLSAGAQADGDAISALAGATLHYFWMAGVSVGYVDALGAADAKARRLLSVGVDARPAFLPRFAEDLAHGPALLDLTLDSISLGVGVFWAEPQDGSFGERRGFETSLGFGVPLLARAEGPWLSARGVIRFAEEAGGGTGRVEPAALLALSFHTFFWAPR